MPVVPTYERREGIAVGSTGPRASGEAFGAAIGRGLQDAGAGIQALGADLNAAMAIKRQDDLERQTFHGRTELQRLRTIGEQLLTDSEQNAEPHASGFTRTFMEKYTKEANKVVQRLPPELRERFAPDLASLEGQFNTRAFNWEIERKNKWYEDEVGKTTARSLVDIDSDPSRFDGAVKDTFAFIDDTGLPAWKKDELKQDFAGSAAEAASMKIAEARARADAINGVPLGQVPRPVAGASTGGGASPGAHRTTLDTGGHDLDELAPPARQMLDGIAASGAVPTLKVLSGRRSPEGNRKAGGAKGSQHLHGNAVDISLAGMSDDEKAAVLEAAIANGARGIGIYKSGRSLHIDTRETPALWGSGDGDAYAGHGVEKAPAWARPVLTKLFNGETVTVASRGVAAGSGSATDALVERIVEAENSTGDPAARNPNSTATGDGQFIESTWLEMMRKHRPQDAARLSEAEQLELRKDPAISRQMVRAYADENGERLRSYGIEPTAGNLYLAHFLGPDTAAGVLKADPGASVEPLVGAKAVAANASVLRGKTAGEVVAWASEKMGGAGAAVADGGTDAGYYRSPVADIVDDPRFAGILTLKQRRAIEQHYVETYRGQSRQTKADDSAAKFEAEQLVQADIASLAATGTPVDGLDVATVEAVLGPAKAEAWLRSRATARQTFAATRDLGMLDDAGLSERLADTEPQPGAPDFDEQAAVHKAVRDAVETQRKLRASDPADAVETIPAVATAKAAMRPDNPASVRALVEARLAAQSAIGIPDALRSPLTTAEARRLGAALSVMDDRTAKGTITDLAEDVRATFGDQADLVFRQVVREVVKDNDLAMLATRIMRKLATGKPPTVSEAATFDTVQEATLADQATAGALPPPPEDAALAERTTDFRGNSFTRFGKPGERSAGPGQQQQHRDPVAETMGFISAHPRYGTIRLAHEKTLKANPAMAELFDRVYGAGAAAAVLSGQADAERAAQAKARADRFGPDGETSEGE